MTSTTISSEANDKGFLFLLLLDKGNVGDIVQMSKNWGSLGHLDDLWGKWDCMFEMGDSNGKSIILINTNNPERLAWVLDPWNTGTPEIGEWETTGFPLFPNLCQPHAMDPWSVFFGTLLPLACISAFDLGLHFLRPTHHLLVYSPLSLCPLRSASPWLPPGFLVSAHLG